MGDDNNFLIFFLPFPPNSFLLCCRFLETCSFALSLWPPSTRSQRQVLQAHPASAVERCRPALPGPSSCEVQWLHHQHVWLGEGRWLFADFRHVQDIRRWGEHVGWGCLCCFEQGVGDSVLQTCSLSVWAWVHVQCVCSDQSANLASLPIWPVCQSGQSANLASLPIWPVCQSDHAANLASLPIWPVCQSGQSANLTSLPIWPVCQSGQSANLTSLPIWPVCQSDQSANLASLPIWPVCQSGQSATLASLPIWPVCQSDQSANLASLPIWPVCQSGQSANLTMLPIWPVCQSGQSANLASLPIWPVCQSQIGQLICKMGRPIWKSFLKFVL